MAGDIIGCRRYRPGTPAKCLMVGRTTGCLDGFAGCVDPARREREYWQQREANEAAEREAVTRAANAREYERRRTSWIEARFMEVAR
jgi:hypothetical protein